MSNSQRKTFDEKKVPAETPMVHSSRGTFGGTTHKSISRSRSLMSLSSSSMLRTLPVEGEVINPLDKEMEIYEEEFSLYLLRVLQGNLIRGEREKQDETKKCLVSLKKEFEQLLQENVTLYDTVQKMEIHGKCLQKLNEYSSKARKLLKVLTETEFYEALHNIALTLEANVNRLRLVGLKRKDIDEAFSENILGFDSDVYRLLKSMEEYAEERDTLLPEIAEKIHEIRLLHAENEKLKVRCTIHANQLRRKTIVADYEKYFRMATEECAHILDKLSEKGIGHSFADETLPQRTAEWGEPASSSTPATSATSGNIKEYVM